MVSLNGSKEQIGSAIPYTDDSLEALRERLLAEGKRQGVPLDVTIDQVRTGGLLSKPTDGLVVRHPDHKRDYYAYAIEAFTGLKQLNVWRFGASAQEKKHRASEDHKRLLDKERAKGKSATEMIGVRIGASLVDGVSRLGKSDRKLAEENEWYNKVTGLLSSALYR